MLGNGGGSSRRVDPRDCIGGTQSDYCAGMGPTVLPAPGEQVKGDFCATVSMTNLQFGPCSSKKYHLTDKTQFTILNVIPSLGTLTTHSSFFRCGDH